MLKEWEKTTTDLSGNLTTNEYLPPEIREKLLKEDLSLINQLDLKEINFPYPCKELANIKGMNILSGLQKKNKNNCLTVYRTVRFPTTYRTWKTINEKGISMSNYEQERILSLYTNEKYNSAREKIRENKNFWFQPQERVVDGLPVFSLVNDALQIHYAYRNNMDKVLMIMGHIPYELIKNKKISLTANTAIDYDYDNNKRDYELKEFVKKDGHYQIDYKSLRAKGIDLHEMYIQNLPFTLKEHKELGIEQKFYLIDIYEINQKDKQIRELFDNSKKLIENEYFLHGFFGDHNIIGRRPSKWMPFTCHEVKLKHSETNYCLNHNPGDQMISGVIFL